MDETDRCPEKHPSHFRINAEHKMASILINGMEVGARCTGYTLTQRAGETALLTLEFEASNCVAYGEAETEEAAQA